MPRYQTPGGTSSINLGWGDAAPAAHPQDRRTNPAAVAQTIDDQKYLDSLLNPAGAAAAMCTTNQDYDVLAPHEKPYNGGRGRGAFQNTTYGVASQPLARDGVGMEYEKERREREQSRAEALLYNAVQPGNELNRHVTGQAYAIHQMQQLEQQKWEDQQRGKAEEARAKQQQQQQQQDEGAQLRMKVQAEIERQNLMMQAAQMKQGFGGGGSFGNAAANPTQHNSQYTSQRAAAPRTEAIGARVLQPRSSSTADYFTSRQGSEKNSHKAKLEEMRERRWREAAEGGGQGVENSNVVVRGSGGRGGGGGTMADLMTWG